MERRLLGESGVWFATWRPSLVCLVLAGSAALVACSGSGEGRRSQDRFDHLIEPIVGGVASGSAHDAVLVVVRFGPGAGQKGLCTGTLVAPNLVLTARHCVSSADASAMCAMDGSAVSGGMLHGDYPAASLGVFTGGTKAAVAAPDPSAANARGAALVVDDATTLCNHDLAFVVTDVAIAAPIAPLRLGAPAAGDALTAVGWGVTATGALPDARQERAGVALVGDGPMAFPDDPRFGVGDREVLIGESACAGDSGSPLFAASGALVGVASRVGNGKPRDPANVASTCVGSGVHAVYTHLGASEALVARAFAAAGATPWLEGEPDPRYARYRPAPTAPSENANANAGGAPSPAPASGSNAALASGEAGAASDASTSAIGCAVGRELRSDPVAEAIGVMSLLVLALRLLRRAAHRHAHARAPDERGPGSRRGGL